MVPFVWLYHPVRCQSDSCNSTNQDPPDQRTTILLPLDHDLSHRPIEESVVIGTIAGVVQW